MEQLLNSAALTFAIVVLICYTIVKILRKRNQLLEQVDNLDKLSRYKYTRKRFIMTQAENDFYKVLKVAYAEKYEIFPQVHLGTFLNHSVGNQDTRAALSVIQRKSVDFLICTPNYYNPVIAIELDDKTHDNPIRSRRDALVNEILHDAGLPIIHIKWRNQYDITEIKTCIDRGIMQLVE